MVGQVACIRNLRITYNILDVNLKRKKPFERPETEFREVVCENKD